MSETVEEAIVALEDYLRRYPSGHFSELAQSRLDRLLAQMGEQKTAIVSSAANPFSKGTAVANPDFRVGDRYEFDVMDLYTKLPLPRVSQTITSVANMEVVYNGGELVTDLLGNPLKRPDGIRVADAQIFPTEYRVGKKWVTRYTLSGRGGDEVEINYAVVAREEITVPAGQFDAFRIEGHGFAMKGGRREFRYWMAPDRVRRVVARELRWWSIGGGPDKAERAELVAYEEKR